MSVILPRDRHPRGASKRSLGSGAMSSSREHGGGEVILYQSPDGEVRLDVRLECESIWLTQKQMAELFGRERSVITRHIQRALADDELSLESNVQKVHIASSDKPVSLYSLEAVISVGYRVNSARGTQFRIWATRTLRDHLLRGYTLNERRLREKGLGEMEQAVGLLARTLAHNELVTDEGSAVLDVVRRYAAAWRLLLEYDEDRLAQAPARPQTAASFSLELAQSLIGDLRAALVAHGQGGTLLGQERGDQLAAILGGLGTDLRPSAALPVGSGAGGAPSLLRDQGPPVHGRQQAHCGAAFPGVPCAQRPLHPCRRFAAGRRQRHRRADLACRRERVGSEGSHDPAHRQPAGGR